MIQFAGSDAESGDAFDVDVEYDAARNDALENEIAELVANIDAATYRLLVLLHEFDARQGWGWGFRNCAHWLSWRTGIDVGAAREKMRVAHALPELPAISEAMRCGTLSYSKARALTRVATPETEQNLLDIALLATASQTERVVRAWRRIDRLAEAEQEQLRHERRELHLHVDADGSYVIRGRLDPEVGAALEKALEKAEESIFRRAQDSEYEVPVRTPDPTQRYADAMGLVAQLALANAENADVVSGDGAERFQVVLHVDRDALEQSGDAGLCELENGARVSAETSRRIACDATQVVMTHDETGKTIDVGRRTRTVSPALRRALDHRDGGCRFPACGLRHCDAHHIEHWADGGATSLDNLVLLCRFHHRKLHEGGFRIEMRGEDVVFHSRGDFEIKLVPKVERLRHDAVRQIVESNHEAGLDIDAETAPTWNGDPLDLDLTMYLLMQEPEQQERDRRNGRRDASDQREGPGHRDGPDQR